MDNTKEIYENEIEPLLEKIYDIAVANKIPFVAMFQIETIRNERGNFDCTIIGQKNIAKESRPAYTHPHIALAGIMEDIPNNLAQHIVGATAPSFLNDLIESQNQAEQLPH